MTLARDQISAAFGTLFALCIDQQLATSKGGHATFDANPSLRLFGPKRRKLRRDDEVTGLDALPAGTIINVWKHENNADMACELRAVLQGEPMEHCMGH